MPADTEHSAATEEHSAFLSKRQVLALIPISSVTLWSWSRTGTFPAPRIIGHKTVWLASEVYGWMETRPTRHYKGMERA
jgi:predicted DNA-binding transcriptional regulator AlpA